MGKVIEFVQRADENDIPKIVPHEKSIIDNTVESLEEDYAQISRLNNLIIREIQSKKGQIAYIEKIWKDFNISEFEIKRRKNFYKELLHGKEMTYLINRLNTEKDEIEKHPTLKKILALCTKAFDIVDTLYNLDFTSQNVSPYGEEETDANKSL